jgi:type VI secretion system protein ImpB
VRQVPPLKGLLEARAKLADLRNKLAGNDKLEDILSDVLGNTEKLGSLRKSTTKGN